MKREEEQRSRRKRIEEQQETIGLLKRFQALDLFSAVARSKNNRRRSDFFHSTKVMRKLGENFERWGKVLDVSASKPLLSPVKVELLKKS